MYHWFVLFFFNSSRGVCMKVENELNRCVTRIDFILFPLLFLLFRILFDLLDSKSSGLKSFCTSFATEIMANALKTNL